MIEVSDENIYIKLRRTRALCRMLSQHAKQEGISMNQYCVYLLARNDALVGK